MTKMTVTDYVGQVHTFFDNTDTKTLSSIHLLLVNCLASIHSPRFCLDIISESENVSVLDVPRRLG